MDKKISNKEGKLHTMKPSKEHDNGIKEQNSRIRDNLKELDWATASFEDMEQAFEDRDPLEFI